MLWNNIKIECKKAMGTRLFLFVVLTGCIITMFSLVPCVQSYNRYISSLKYISEEFSYIRNPMMSSQTLFNYWIGSEAITPGSTNYFFLFPILVSLPYGWSYCMERRSGYIQNVVVSRKLKSKGITIAKPPDPYYITSYGIISSSFLSEFFYTRPFLYVFLYLMVDFIYCGLIACLCAACAAFVKNHVIVVLLPFIALLGFNYICNSFIYISGDVVYTELSPMNFLRAVPAGYDTNGFVVCTGAVILLLFILVTTVVREAPNEVY